MHSRRAVHAKRFVAVATLLLGLCACGRDGGSPDAAPPASSAPASRAERQAPELWSELERIERQGASQPDASIAALREILGRAAAGTPERAETLALLANVYGRARARDGVSLLEQELAVWPQTPEARATRVDAQLALATARAVYNRAQGDLREAAQAIADLDQLDLGQASSRQLLRARSTQATVFSETGEPKLALHTAQLAVDLANSYGRAWRRAVAYDDLAFCYYQADELAAARQTEDQAIALGRSDPDPVLMNALLNLRGMVYSGVGDDSISRQSLVDALAYAEKSGDEGQRALGLGNLADFQLRHGQYAQALATAQQAIPVARKTRRLTAEIGARQNAGLAKIALGRVAEGRDDVKIAITMDEQDGSAAYVAGDWNELGQYLERAGDYAGAIDAYHEYRRVIDRLLRDDTRKAVIDTQERFEAERRAKEIELLNRDNRLKSEQIRARDLSLAFWGVLGGCAVLIAALLALAYQRIRRSNRQLAVSNAHLKVQSECDPLTGLANRRHFQSAIKRLTEAGGAGRFSGTVFLIDIDHFKRINDVHGHAAGDVVLVEIARRLKAAVREHDLVVRWGGEEFLIVCGDAGEEPAAAAADHQVARAFADSRALEAAPAQALGQRLLDLVGGAPVEYGGRPIAVSASIGFASFPVAPHGLALHWERAIDLADTVMFIAKAHGRNKAYGLTHLDAADEAGAARLATRLEDAWHDGRVRLVALQGPNRERRP
ncbi:MAG: GGDEF domain-containing protein [Pelomonas sp.]|nr:GGDEF domain-containing protein [Roseateles sp.]